MFKYIDPAESGAVLPIVHVNGYKISQRTIYGTMDDKEIVALFRCVHFLACRRRSNDCERRRSGYGYQVRVVEDLENIDQDLAASIEWALVEIHKIQKAARSGKPIVKPRWPVLILRTPKVAVQCFMGLFLIIVMTTGLGCAKVIPQSSYRRLFPCPPGSSPCSQAGRRAACLAFLVAVVLQAFRTFRRRWMSYHQDS